MASNDLDMALAAHLEGLPAATLGKLVLRLAATRPDARRECFEYLADHVGSVEPGGVRTAADEAVLALWYELEPDLQDMDDFGGGRDDVSQNVVDLLYRLEVRISESQIDRGVRQELTDLLLPFLRSGNAGVDDALYSVGYAACHDQDDLRRWARMLTEMPAEWLKGHARRIYRAIGDREAYLRLRHAKMQYGNDYHDLATFHWENGEEERALEVAEEGLRNATGSLDELRTFLAERAREEGNRTRYLALQLDMAIDRLTLDRYQTLRKLCTQEEWSSVEPVVLSALATAWPDERLRIRLHRREYAEALTALRESAGPLHRSESSAAREAAKRLESRFPEEILTYYLSLAGDLTRVGNRKEYSRRAEVVRRIRRVLVDELHDEERWGDFARRIAEANRRRPACLEEFGRTVPGWHHVV